MSGSNRKRDTVAVFAVIGGAVIPVLAAALLAAASAGAQTSDEERENLRAR